MRAVPSWNYCYRSLRGCGVAFLALTLALSARAQIFELLTSIDPGLGPSASAGGDSRAPLISPDGRYVVFASTANNLATLTNSHLVPTAVPAEFNVYIRDRISGTTALVSVTASGDGGGNGNSVPSGISSNGQYVLFESNASDLVPGDTNNSRDVFLRDLVTRTTELVSISTNGLAGDGASRSAVMTPDGRYVAFVSEASDLVTGDTNAIADVFLRDMRDGVTRLISVGASSATAAGLPSRSEAPVLTPDGRYVAFYSTATNLVPGAPDGGDIYVRDVLGGTTLWASSFARTAVPSNNVVACNHGISDNGQVVSYEAIAPFENWGVLLRYDALSGVTQTIHTNAAVPTGAYEDCRSVELTSDGRYLVFLANTNGTSGITTCVLLYDAVTGTSTLASGDALGQVQPGSICDWPAVDRSGRYVIFLSTATNLTSNPLNGEYHVYLRDMAMGTTLLVDTDPGGAGSPVGASTAPQLSPDGRVIAFEAADSALVAGDRNRAWDVFVRDLQAQQAELISARQARLASSTPNGCSALSTTSVSSNGDWVAFVSDADDLVRNDNNGCRDVFVRDRPGGSTRLVSVAPDGFSGHGPSSEPAISSDGRYVAFSSLGDNLVPGDGNGLPDVFVRDLLAETTTLVSVKSGGGGTGNGASYSPMIGAGGRYVLFTSWAHDLAPAASAYTNLFVRDLKLGITYALTTSGFWSGIMTPAGRYVGLVDAAQNLKVWDSQSAAIVYTGPTAVRTGACISPDGTRLAYWNPAFTISIYGLIRPSMTPWLINSGLRSLTVAPRFSGDSQYLIFAGGVEGGTNSLYLYHVQSQTSSLVNQTTNSSLFESADISVDGRFVAYSSAATNRVAYDGNRVQDVFLWDRLTGATTLLSSSRLGIASGNSCALAPAFAGDGRTLCFETWASDLLENDFNRSADLLAYELYAGSPLFQITIVPSTTLGQSPWLTWPVASGKNYRVQYKSSLTDSSWQTSPAGITIIADRGFFADTLAPAVQRYYRVLAF